MTHTGQVLGSGVGTIRLTFGPTRISLTLKARKRGDFPSHQRILGIPPKARIQIALMKMGEKRAAAHIPIVVDHLRI